MFHFKFQTIRSLAAAGLVIALLFGCEENPSSPPIDKPAGKLSGQWAEIFPDTTTEIGLRDYRERIGYGTMFEYPWLADTLKFISDSTFLSKPALELDFVLSRYKIHDDTLITWSPRFTIDTGRTYFRIKGDTLVLGSDSGTHYTRF